MNITKRDVKDAFGLTTDKELAAFFDCTRQTIWLWGAETKPLPAARQWELLARYPDKFRANGKKRKAA